MLEGVYEFNPRYANTYDAQDALAFALASRLSYERNQANVGETANTWGFGEVRSFNLKRGRDVDSQGYIASDDQRMLVAFRGTHSLPDWLTNIQIAKEAGPKGKVHEGFQDAFFVTALSIGKSIGANVNDREIWITGHSLGGALAILLAATLAENNIPVAGLYTFGAPRVGDRPFAGWLNNSLQEVPNYRVVNEGDIVPHVPSELRFWHSGERSLLMNNGTIRSDPRTWRDFTEAMWGWIGRRRSVKIKDSHSLEHGYLPKLAKLAR